MKILHPNHNKYQPLKDLKEYYNDGYYEIIAKDEYPKLDYFLKCFKDFSKNANDLKIAKKNYINLPFSLNTDTWKERQKDAKLVSTLIKNKTALDILDVGAWNGWLSNYLTQKGHNLIATNMFTDAYNGISAYKNYETKFMALQLFANDIFRIKQPFDLIVFNRNWAYFKGPQSVFNDAKKLLKPGGKIIFTGLPFYKNPIQIKTKVQILSTDFEKKYHVPLLYNPSKGYLNSADKLFFKKNKIKLHPYSRFKNCIKIIFRKRVSLHYGVYINNN